MLNRFKLGRTVRLGVFPLLVSGLVPVQAEECPSPKQVADYLKLSVTVVQPGVTLTLSGKKFIVGIVEGDKGEIRTGINAPKKLSVLQTRNAGIGIVPEGFCRYNEGTIMGGVTFSMHLVPESAFKGYWDVVKNSSSVRFYGDYKKAQETLRQALGEIPNPPTLQNPPKVASALAESKELKIFMPKNSKEAYRVLGIQEKATLDEANEAYRVLSRKYHPDFNKGNMEAMEKFEALNKAIGLLRKEDKDHKRIGALVKAMRG